MVGVIVSIDHNLHHTVDIEFHDITSHRAIHFKDHFGFSMAALGENGAVFSVPVKKDSIDGKIIAPSPVHYRPFETWGGSNEWTVYLPAEESALALAVSDKWISVATDQNYVRIFGKSGIQSYIFSIPSGSIVSMTAFEETLFLIYNSSTEQGSRLEYELFDLETKRSLMSVAPLPVSSKSKLEWVGFSETGVR
jgi:chromosome transmission fidelity protein 4